MTKYYKVLTTELKSICQNSNRLPQKYIVQYKLNEWAYPSMPKSALFVFGSLDKATYFAKYEMSCPCFIYECKVKNPRPCKYVADFDPLELWEFYNKAKVKSKLPLHENFSFAPTDSFLVNAVKITKRVD